MGVRAVERSMRELGYELVEVLGAGGMGQVWRARELSLDRMVAIKFIDEAKIEPDMRQRFVTEARALARIQHANVVVVYSLGEVEDRPFLCYELVEGVGVDELATSLPWQRALEIGLDLARGLAAAHQAGVLHRDLKPANAMVTSTGVAKLIDFGLAKLLHESRPTDAESDRPTPLERWLSGQTDGSSDGSTELADATRELSLDALDEPASGNGGPGLTQTGVLLGTPRYIAPELWLGKPASERTDVYALGLIIWELLAKQPAHADVDRAVLPCAIVDESLPSLASLRPELPVELADIVDKAVAKHPHERFESAAALALALEHVIETLQALGRLPRRSTGRASADFSLEEVGALTASLARTLADGSFVPRFYARLFAVDPSLRALFPSDLHGQSQKLADALRLAISMLRDPIRLTMSLEELGARHVLYGVVEAHLDTARTVLFELLIASEGAAMTSELRAAWTRAWDALDEAIRRGMRRALQSAAPSLATPPPSLPPTRWIWAGKTSIAAQTFGSGPIDVLFIPAWVSHCEIAWRLPDYAAFMRELGSHARVTVIDKRGTGMSDRMSTTAPLEDRIQDFTATLDSLDLESAVLFGVRGGGALAASLAALQPERVRGLIWYAPGRRVLTGEDNPDGMTPEAFLAIAEAIERDWGKPLLVDLLAPSRAHDPEFLRWWADYLRNGASPTVARGMLEISANVDFSSLLPGVGVPTLLIHRTGDRSVGAAGVRLLLSEIAGSRLAELPGEDHLPWIGDRRALVDVVARYLTELPGLVRARRRAQAWLALDLLHGATELRRATGSLAAMLEALELVRARAIRRAVVHIGVEIDDDPRPRNRTLELLEKSRELAPAGSVLASADACSLVFGAPLEFERLDDELSRVRRAGDSDYWSAGSSFVTR